MIAAYQRDEALLRDLAEPASTPNELKIWWLGQSGFLVRNAGSFLLLDPYLSDSLTKKYAATDKPHVRMTERVISPERLSGIDVVTSSHNHTDHLDAETLRLLMDANPGIHFVIPEANRQFVSERLALDPALPIGVDDGASIEIAGWRITGIAAAHNDIERDSLGRCHYLGYLIQRGTWSLYHSGDTLLYDGLPERLRSFGPIDVAFLPINGNRPERRVAGNMDGREAATLANAIGACFVVPHHFEMFEFNTADPNELFLPECDRLRQPYRLLKAGEGFVVPAAG